MPPGQKRFEEGMGFQKIIGDAKSDHSTHHHSMQHRAVSLLQNEEAGGAGGNYSRTPELRVSHKLAERKRRSEMKDLFEELNKCVPANGGAKASKWEILSKGKLEPFSPQFQSGLLMRSLQLSSTSKPYRQVSTTCATG